MKDEPVGKSKDKFLVLSTLITPEKESVPLQEIVRVLFPEINMDFIIHTTFFAVE